MKFPNDSNGDTLRRMHSSGFDFKSMHNVEFFAVLPTEKLANSTAEEFLADHKAGDTLQAIETLPADDGGMTLTLVKNMIITHENICEFEKKIAKRVSKRGGHLDGWGVKQLPTKKTRPTKKRT